ncbi:50S ribosomal protein L5 [Patescibacteria group bacterium]|nr:50S ribosomal protein L5 [Patescibacteria group bacterium]
MNRLREKYVKQVRKDLQGKLSLKNVMAVPKVEKVIINAGVGKTLKDPKMLEAIIEDLRKITGQQPVKTLSRKSISGFKIRENQVVGIKVTLRGDRMYDFVDKLVSIALPRVRDFRGLSKKAFDGQGNYHIGVREQTVFPEISEEGLEHSFGFQISIVTNAGDDKKGYELLKALGFPFNEQ